MKGFQYFLVAYLLLIFLVLVSVRLLVLGTFQIIDHVSLIEDVDMKYHILTLWICVFVSAPCIFVPGVVWVVKLYKLGMGEFKNKKILKLY